MGDAENQGGNDQQGGGSAAKKIVSIIVVIIILVLLCILGVYIYKKVTEGKTGGEEAEAAGLKSIERNLTSSKSSGSDKKKEKLKDSIKADYLKQETQELPEMAIQG